MKHKNSSRKQSKAAVTLLQSAVRAHVNSSAIDFSPSADEVAMRAYYNFISKGSKPGHDLQHWLEAETQLLAERSYSFEQNYQDRT